MKSKLSQYIIASQSHQKLSKKEESRKRPSNHHDFLKMYYLYKYKHVYAKSLLVNTFKKSTQYNLFSVHKMFTPLLRCSVEFVTFCRAVKVQYHLPFFKHKKHKFLTLRGFIQGLHHIYLQLERNICLKYNIIV